MSLFEKIVRAKHRWILFGGSLVFILFFYLVLMAHYKTFSFSNQSDLLYRLEAVILDLKIRLRGPLKTSGKIGILAIDEAAIERFGKWPFPRKYYEQVLKNLKKYGVKWVGLDAIYSEVEKTYLEDVRDQVLSRKTNHNMGISREDFDRLVRSSPGDISFANALRSFDNIVFGYFFFSSADETEKNLGSSEPFPNFDLLSLSRVEIELPEGKSLEEYRNIKKGYGYVSNTSAILGKEPLAGFFSNDSDQDAINRWIVLLANINGQMLPSLSLKAVASFLVKEPYVVFDEYGISNVYLVDQENSESVIEVPVDPFGSGRMLLNPIGPAYSFKHYSLADVYGDTLSEEDKASLNGMSLLLGATATGINDVRPNQFDNTLDGVENHATAMENIITQNYMRRPPEIYGLEIVSLVLIGVFFTMIVVFGNAIVSGLGALIFLSSYIYLDYLFWFGQGVWVYLGIPCLEIITIYLAGVSYKYLIEEKERKKVKGAFEHYLSPEVIEDVLQDPDHLKLGGDKKELTVFFSDVRGFTTISESLAPEKLCELMNHYFTPMTALILKSGGVLDKYIGDAIMAFWGAPIPLSNGPQLACKVSLEMLFTLDRLREDFLRRGYPPIDIGIGLNTGLMSVGNMGSEDRFTYTVMGDAVNLGARLEGLTKEYGVKIIISKFTAEKLDPKEFFFRGLDVIRVKGKTEPVKICELMRSDFLGHQRMISEFIEIFSAARLSYANRDFVRAKKFFGECLQLKPDDKPTNIYIDRLEQYLNDPPPENWDGVFTFGYK